MEKFSADHKAWAERSVVSPAAPGYVNILSTSRCNLSCFMCYHRYIDDMNVVIEPEKLDPFLENARTVHLTGGEPFWITETVNLTAGRILDRIINRYPRIKLGANTNGTLLKGKMEELVMEKFEYVSFSIDTMDPRLYEKIRGKPLLDNLLANMERLNELKKKRGLGRNDKPFINVYSIVMDATLDGLPDLTKRMGKLGVRGQYITKLWDFLNAGIGLFDMKKRLLQFKTPSETGELFKAHEQDIAEQGLKHDSSTQKRIEKTRIGLLEAAASTGIAIDDRSGFFNITDRSHPLPNATESVCPEPWVSAVIGQNGDVYFCCSNSVRLGNLNEQSFDEIWNGDAARELRASFIRGEMKGCVKECCEALTDYFPIGEPINLPE